MKDKITMCNGCVDVVWMLCGCVRITNRDIESNNSHTHMHTCMHTHTYSILWLISKVCVAQNSEAFNCFINTWIPSLDCYITTDLRS